MTATTLTPAARSYGWRNWQDAAREALIAASLALIAALLHSGGLTRDVFVRNAMIALAILLGARGLETALSWAIEQSRVPLFFRLILYILGAGVACFVVTGLEFDFTDILAVAVLTALTIGFILHHNRKRYDRLRISIERLKEHEFAEKELEIAREMQHRLLAPPLVERDGLRVTARTHAAHIVGGDFYDVLRLSDRESAILAADVSGKGIAASLIMASCKAMIPFLAASGSAADVMHALNARLCEQLQRREFVAMVLVRFDHHSGRAEIVNAGMPEPLRLRDGRAEAVSFSGDRLPLGAMRGARYEASTIELAPGERLLLFSDGLPEASVEGSPIGYEKVEELAANAPSVEELVSRLRAIDGIHIDDDVTVVSLERAR
jgi:Stage II sporulation protein E (SpoIIE)